MAPTPTAATPSHTLDRGLRVLELLRHAPEGLTVTELARALETHRAAVYRVLGPLTDHHLVRRLPAGRVVLGPGLIDLAQGVQPRLIEVAGPILRTLATAVGATAALTVRDGDDGVVALVVTPPDLPLHISYRTGLRHPLTSGAPGHALLAADAPRADETAELIATRDRGWSVTSGELLPGATGVAAVLPTRAHPPDAAISAVWITARDPAAVAQHVIAAAAQIVRELGTG